MNTTTIQFDTIPQALKDRKQWVVWRLVPKKSETKPTKIPYNAVTGGLASSTNPETWSTFEAASARFARGGYSGIGFTFDYDDPYAGIDLDHCRNPETGAIEPEAQAIITRLNSYAEISQSGAGVHIFVEGSVPVGRKSKQVEIYSDDRYFTVTGHHLTGTPLTIEARQAELTALYTKHFPPTPDPEPRPTVHITADDETQLAKMFASKSGKKIRKLFDGEWSDHPDWTHSEADSSLACYLAFWFGRDPERMDRIFRQSGLMREKWDRKLKDGTYGSYCIAHACAVTTTVYKEESDEGWIKTTADTIQRDTHFAKDAGGLLYAFEGGVYRPTGTEVIERRVKGLVIETETTKVWSRHRVVELAAWIAVDAPVLWERPPLTTINVLNGLLDLATRELRPHDPAYLTPIQLPVHYDPTATCPRWEAFVKAVFPEDCRDLAYQLVRWLMVPDLSTQQAVLFVGEGGNGKSTYLTAVTTFLGSENVAGLSLHRLENDKFATVRLIGKLANICADMPSAHLASTSVFKEITGGDPIPAERKFQGGFEFVPFCRLIFSANHYPESSDSSMAFFRRWVVVPFHRTFEEKERRGKDELDAELATPSELSGVLNRALKENGGVVVSDSMRAATEEFVEMTDPIASWLDRSTEVKPDGVVTKKDLAIAFNGWAVEAGRPIISAKQFHKAVRRLRPKLIEVKDAFHHDAYKGLLLKSVWS